MGTSYIYISKITQVGQATNQEPTPSPLDSPIFFYSSPVILSNYFTPFPFPFPFPLTRPFPSPPTTSFPTLFTPSGTQNLLSNPPQLSTLYSSCTFAHFLNPHSVTPTIRQLSNMNAMLPSPTFMGCRAALDALVWVAASGPWPDMMLWREAPAGWKPPLPLALAS
ncbi:hypothetical protein K402DRAFT_183680 [Aulographum hederae CBS 113979]|uniref:Uncharacterized protein n=1 Tax=Aulographum hederae CBS 113979 TaxID=1176131 RepID=A0A6G1GPP8_9PEZI|nr:hypothetical protein K402DRAFT_183680 [Aulographum hederae CBS 113979]